MPDGLLAPPPVQRERKPAGAQYAAGRRVRFASQRIRFSMPPRKTPVPALPPSRDQTDPATNSLLLAFMFARQRLERGGRLDQPPRLSRINSRANIKTTGGRRDPSLRRRGASLTRRGAKQPQRATGPYPSSHAHAHGQTPYLHQIASFSFRFALLRLASLRGGSVLKFRPHVSTEPHLRRSWALRFGAQ